MAFPMEHNLCLASWRQDLDAGDENKLLDQRLSNTVLWATKAPPFIGLYRTGIVSRTHLSACQTLFRSGKSIKKKA